MRVPVKSAGSRSGVNWMRRNFSESESVNEGSATTADYNYVLTNTSTAGADDPLTITSLVDDRGTVDTSDDINVLSGTLTGDTNTDGILDVGETWTYTVTGVDIPAGTSASAMTTTTSCSVPGGTISSSSISSTTRHRTPRSWTGPTVC